MVSSLDATDLEDLQLEDRVLVLAQDSTGYAGCIIVPEEPAPRCRGDVRHEAAIAHAVGYDDRRLAIAVELLAPPPVRRVSIRQAVRQAADTATKRLARYGPIEHSKKASIRDVTVTALVGLGYRADGGLPRLHAGVPRRIEPAPPEQEASRPTRPIERQLARAPIGCNNSVTELTALRTWFDGVGGHIVHYATARHGLPVGVVRDGERRVVVVAVCPEVDGRVDAGAAVWHVDEHLVQMQADVRRARRQLARAGVAGLVVEDRPLYKGFQLLQHIGTAIRRAVVAPIELAARPDSTATDRTMTGYHAAVVAEVLTRCPRRAVTHGPTRSGGSPLVADLMRTMAMK